MPDQPTKTKRSRLSQSSSTSKMPRSFWARPTAIVIKKSPVSGKLRGFRPQRETTRVVLTTVNLSITALGLFDGSVLL